MLNNGRLKFEFMSFAFLCSVSLLQSYGSLFSFSAMINIYYQILVFVVVKRSLIICVIHSSIQSYLRSRCNWILREHVTWMRARGGGASRHSREDEYKE